MHAEQLLQGICVLCTKFGVDSPSRFLFRVRTNRLMRLNALPTMAAIQLAWVIQNVIIAGLKTILHGFSHNTGLTETRIGRFTCAFSIILCLYSVYCTDCRYVRIL